MGGKKVESIVWKGRKFKQVIMAHKCFLFNWSVLADTAETKHKKSTKVQISSNVTLNDDLNDIA